MFLKSSKKVGESQMSEFKGEKLLKLIRKQQSSRTLYDEGRKIAGSEMKSILEAGRWAPTAHNMQNFQVVVVDDRALLDSLGSIRYDTSDVFIHENYQQLSFSEKELLSKKVGLLASMFPPAWRKPDYQAEETTDDDARSSSWGDMIRSNSALLIVVYDPRKRAPASEGDFLGTMSLGCVMENMWLMATSLGIAFQVVSSLGADSVAEEVRILLNIPEELKIGFTVRLGYSAPAAEKYLRVRREVEDFTHHNSFDNQGWH
jgi:nitroreductase